MKIDFPQNRSFGDRVCAYLAIPWGLRSALLLEQFLTCMWAITQMHRIRTHLRKAKPYLEASTLELPPPEC